ncbi:cell division control protein 48 homolog B isoform X3 [Vigna unguiculata]|uniref:cell division control protein 48 homolog B isoform X3 n=1 Tax=Vigna unguiculata TaxID=3917 RepID=UPI0010168D4B|nr:cell division control protein 48 homolog B isoform X3 [Vigna unguiculata]
MESCTSNSSDNNNHWRAEDAIGGNAEALQALRELIIFPHHFSREAQKLGLKWSRGLLLYGPPGTGKTSLVRAVVRECGAHLTIIRREQDVRLASQLFTLMDSNKPTYSTPGVVVVASTNRVDAIDPALRRYGRFDAEIEVTVPNEEDRYQILKLYTKKIPLDPSIDLKSIAALCNGYVGADLEALCCEATMIASKRSSNAKDASNFSLTMEDWKNARSVVGPSITRGVTVEIPKVTWEDIGGLKEVKKKLQQAVEWPIKHAAAFSRFGISPVRGILLHGPPGCSKTTLAKAAAHAAQASFFSLSAAELYSMYVGEGEALLRKTFHRARLAAPSIIFFDEADVVAAKRGDSSSNSATVGERLLSTLLTEIDGLEETKGILVLAATNRPYAIDAALMRPGRFDQVLYVPPPDLEARYEILCLHTRKMRIGHDVDFRRLAEDTELFTGAELEGLCREAGIVALREDISAAVVFDRHFQIAKSSLKPALTKQEIDSYSSFKKTSSRVLPSHSEAGLKADKGKRNRSDSLSLVKIGVVSCFLVAAAKYIYLWGNQSLPDIPT